MSKLNKLPVKNEVIHQLAIGETQTNIAKQVGVDRSNISRFAKEDENIQLIEEEREKLERAGMINGEESEENSVIEKW